MDNQHKQATSRRHHCCPKSRAPPRSRRNGRSWQKVAKTVRELHIRRATELHEDIEAILTFACLFCAVVAWFVLGTSISPQTTSSVQRSSPIERLLAHKSNFPADPIFLTVPRSDYQSPRVLLLLPLASGLWLASFIMSLIGVLVGVLVKKRLSEHLKAVADSFERQFCGCRHSHYLLEKRKALEVALLPVLCASVILFFSGMLCVATASAIVRTTLAIW